MERVTQAEVDALLARIRNNPGDGEAVAEYEEIASAARRQMARDMRDAMAAGEGYQSVFVLYLSPDELKRIFGSDPALSDLQIRACADSARAVAYYNLSTMASPENLQS